MRIYSCLFMTVLLGRSLMVSAGAMEEVRPAQISTGSAASWHGPKLRLAVPDLSASALKNLAGAPQQGTASIPLPTEFARGLTEMLITALVKTNRFVVVERLPGDKVTAEQDLAAGPRADAATAPQVGKLAGAQAIITGDITEFSYSHSSYGATLAGLHGLGSNLGKKKVTARVTIDLRIVDAATGQIIAAERAEGKASMSDVSAELLKGRQSLNAALAEDTPLG
jgi:curli biogenesis system outer membrane secretion channel CsgG